MDFDSKPSQQDFEGQTSPKPNIDDLAESIIADIPYLSFERGIDGKPSMIKGPIHVTGKLVEWIADHHANPEIRDRLGSKPKNPKNG